MKCVVIYTKMMEENLIMWKDGMVYYCVKEAGYSVIRFRMIWEN